MTSSDAASAVYFLRNLAPRSAEEQQELLHVINALSSYSNKSRNVYNDRSSISAG